MAENFAMFELVPTLGSDMGLSVLQAIDRSSMRSDRILLSEDSSELCHR